MQTVWMEHGSAIAIARAWGEGGMQQKAQRKVRRTTRDAAARLAWSGTLGFGPSNCRANQLPWLHGTTSISEGEANGTIDCAACEGRGTGKVEAMASVAGL